MKIPIKGWETSFDFVYSSKLPVFMFSSRLAPVSIMEEIEKIVRLFLWGTRDGVRKIHLLSFEGVCLPKEFGGLGIKQAREINLALLCKWFWRLKQDRLWVRLLKEKYGSVLGGIYPKERKLPFGVTVWRGLSYVFVLYNCLTGMKVGNGSFTKFWLDKWCIGFSLANMFPELFESSCMKTCSVKDVFNPGQVGLDRWTSGIDPMVAVREPDKLFFLFTILDKVEIEEGVDQVVWEDRSKKFLVSICFTKILNLGLKYFCLGIFPFCWDRVWDRRIPSKFYFFVWLLARNTVLTQA